MKQFLSISSLILLLTACTQSAPSTGDTESQAMQKVSVVTSFYPQTHFAEEVAGDLATVEQITPLGSDPHSYEPTPKKMQQVYNADLLIFNGAGQDEWAERIHSELEGNGVRTIAATEIVERMAYEEEDHDEHDDHDEHGHHDDHADHDDHDDHEDDHEDHDEHGHHDHEHGEWDPHVWLDPVRAQKIVQTIASELSAIDPTNAEGYKSNADSYVLRLQELDTDIRTGLSNCALDSVIVSHDAFRYLAARYEFHTLEIAGLSPSAVPSPARLAELADVASEEGIQHVFFETHVSSALSDTLAEEIGAETLVLHSLEARTQEERTAGKTYIDLMRQNFANLQIALQCS